MDEGRPSIEESNMAERRADVFERCETLGPFKFGTEQTKALATKWNVTIQTIYNDRKMWLDSIPEPKVEGMGKKIFKSFDMMFGNAYFMSQSLDPNISSKGIALLIDAIREFKAFMEAWGYKEKVAEKYQIEGDINLRMVQEKWAKVFEKIKGLPQEAQDEVRKAILGE